MVWHMFGAHDLFGTRTGRRQRGMDRIGNASLDDAVSLDLLRIAQLCVRCTTRTLAVRGSAEVCVAASRRQRSELSVVAWRLQSPGRSVTMMTTTLGLPVPVLGPRESWRIWRMKQPKGARRKLPCRSLSAPQRRPGGSHGRKPEVVLKGARRSLSLRDGFQSLIWKHFDPEQDLYRRQSLRSAGTHQILSPGWPWDLLHVEARAG